MPTRINFKLLLLTLTILVFTGTGAFFVHRFQVQRNAADLLVEAEHAQEQRHPDRAVRFLSRYLMLRPHDVDARVRIAELLEQSAASPRQLRQVLGAYQQVLLRDDRPTMHRKVAALQLVLGDYDDAQAELEALLKTDNDPLLNHQLGLCHEAKGQYIP